jgi:hypothetical protein
VSPGRQHSIVGARIANVVVGFWLFVSAFLWPHSQGQRLTAWVVGMVAVSAALAGLSGHRWGRYVNVVAGGWLIVSSLVPTIGRATFWNHMLVGFLLVMFGLAPSLTALRERRPVSP